MERSQREIRWQRVWPFTTDPSPSASEESQEVEKAGLPLRRDHIETQSAESAYPSEIRGVYIISVAARLLSMHPQTLRKYERVGLVAPSRTGGMLRLYSEEDIARLQLIKHLVEDLGLNLAGVELVLELVHRLLRLRVSTSRVQNPAVLAQLVANQLDAIFDLVNLSFPTGHER